VVDNWEDEAAEVDAAAAASAASAEFVARTIVARI